MECGVCWSIYDPHLGDPVFGIPPGTPFSSLPEEWNCPRCHAKPFQFLPVKVQPRRDAAEGFDLQQRVTKMVSAYQSIAEKQMFDLPVYNHKLKVEAVAFQPWGDCALGVLITPWFMNVVVLPRRNKEWAILRDGAQIGWTFPSGRYTFVVCDLEGFGVVQSCSLFSPMGMFDEQDVARITARAALEAMLGTDTEAMPSMSRREFLTRCAAE